MMSVVVIDVLLVSGMGSVPHGRIARYVGSVLVFLYMLSARVYM